MCGDICSPLCGDIWNPPAVPAPPGVESATLSAFVRLRSRLLFFSFLAFFSSLPSASTAASDGGPCAAQAPSGAKASTTLPTALSCSGDATFSLRLLRLRSLCLPSLPPLFLRERSSGAAKESRPASAATGATAPLPGPPSDSPFASRTLGSSTPSGANFFSSYLARIQVLSFFASFSSILSPPALFTLPMYFVPAGTLCS
mmetsp:Transcript_30366/g.100792  ORF Transcript_30366/g.100792 Transcript_30366/m.100792 type:complete len:201 (+) Transcript_30366:4195-4797(+)